MTAPDQNCKSAFGDARLGASTEAFTVQVGYSAILFYGYVGVIGFILFAVMRWGFKSETTLVQTWCAYGEHLARTIISSLTHVSELLKALL